MNKSPSEKCQEKKKILTQWHITRLKNIEDNEIEWHENYKTLKTYIKWMGGKVGKYNDDDLFKILEVFDKLGGYEFFEKHNIGSIPCGTSGIECDII